jgi:pimeloyl-ACP methyl ester carboxylesterase
MLRLIAVLSLLIATQTWPGGAIWSSKAVASERNVVVLLHGLGRSKSAMWLLAQRLETAGYQVESIGYRSLHRTPEQILTHLQSKVGNCCASSDTKIHFVGHSLGGLIVRAYLAKNKPPNLGRVVLLGTPNSGAHLADLYGDKWWFKLLGPTAQFLGTGRDSLPRSLPAPDYPVGVIAGIANRVSNDHILPGDDDGLVSVESTKLEGMTDFVVVQTGHSAMRYSSAVANQVVSFLKNGRFLESPR